MRATLRSEAPDIHWTTTQVRLTFLAQVPGISEEKFVELAEGAKKGRPVSKVLNAEILLDAKLVYGRY